MCELALKSDPALVSIVFYRTPTIDARLKLASELTLSILPQRTRKSGGHDEPLVATWKQIETEINDLLPVRNLIAHSPVKMNVSYPHDAPSPKERILATKVSYEITTSERERLRGRNPRQIRDEELRSHLATLRDVHARLDAFVSGPLTKALT